MRRLKISSPSTTSRRSSSSASDAVPETFEASLQLAEAALVDIGVPMGLVIASIHEERDQFRSRFGVREALPAE